MKKEIIQKYEALLAAIDPEVLAEKIGLKHQYAFQSNTFPADINTPEEFQQALGIFYQNQCKAIGKNAPTLSESIEEARQYLGENETDAFKQSKENTEDGFIGVCKKIADSLKREEEVAFIRARVREHINLFSYDEKEQFAQYYLQTKMPYYTAEETKLRVMKIAQNIDNFADFYVQGMNAQRHP